MDEDHSDFVSFEGVETWWGDDIVSGALNTTLVTIRGREPGGAPMLLTMRFEDFQRVALTLQEQWNLDVEMSSELAAMLVLQQYFTAGKSP